MLKKLMILTFCAILGFGFYQSAYTQPVVNIAENDSNELTRLEHTYEKIRSDATLSNVERANEIFDCSNKFKQYIDQYYDKLLEALDGEGKKYLTDSRDKWNDFAAANEKLNESIVNAKYSSGSTGSIAILILQYEDYRTRAYELRKKCESLYINLD
jgi:hypothetical protein